MHYQIENLTGEEAQALWNALGELPAKHTFALMQKIERQFMAQEKEAAEAAQRAATNPLTTTGGGSHGEG